MIDIGLYPDAVLDDSIKNGDYVMFEGKSYLCERFEHNGEIFFTHLVTPEEIDVHVEIGSYKNQFRHIRIHGVSAVGTREDFYHALLNKRARGNC